MYLMVDNEASYSLPTHWLIVGWDDFSRLGLLEPMDLERSKQVVLFLIHNIAFRENWDQMQKK
jgi:hypothetical protein